MIPPYGAGSGTDLPTECTRTTTRAETPHDRSSNYNNDIAEYWEFSDYGYYPIDLSNEAYKFGVNYVMYALTH